jgi:integrase
MPHIRKPRTPSQRRKIAKGIKYAVVTLTDRAGKRRDVILGRWRTDEAEAAYHRKINEWLANGRTYEPSERDADAHKADAANDITIAELLLHYYEYAETYYRRKDGSATNELSDIRLSLRPVREMYADLEAKDFGPLALKAVRERMITQPIVARFKTTDPKSGKRIWAEKVIRHGLARGVINSRIDRIRRAFQWAASEQLIKVSVFQALMTVTHLQAGRSAARETQRIRPVAPALVQNTLPYLSSTVADIVRLLMLTGMRAGEAASMKACEFDMSGPIWVYRPSHHKTAHHDQERVIALGPQAQQIIKNYLRADTHSCLFSPLRTVEDFRAKQRRERRTPVQPSQVCRNALRPKKRPRDHYTTEVLSQAIWRACRKAGLPRWHLHQLRHSVGTEARRQFGLDHAKAVLGHRSAGVTTVYAELDQEKAKQVAAKLG